MSTENWREVYRTEPEVFDAFSRAEDPHGALPALLRAHAPLDGAHVLEVGCGSGRLASRLAPHAARYVAVEPSAPLLALAASRTSGVAHLLRARGEALPLAAASVDVVLAGWVFAYLPAGVRARALADASRVLRGGARDAGIWLLENHWESEFQELRGRSGDAESAEVGPLRDAGFRVVASCETEIAFATEGECARVVGRLCGDAAARRLAARPRRRIGHRVVLLHRPV